MRRRRAAVCSAVAAAPRAISFLRRNGVGCLRRLIFLHQPVRNASGGILFSGLSEKSMQKRDAGERNSAYAPEKLFVSLYVLSFCFRRLNALRAAVGSGFPSARHAVQVALFAPVEYLTYGSRNSRRVFRLPRQLNKNASVARLDNLKQFPHKTSPGENPRKGAAAPFLVVLRGIVKGENRNSPLTILSFDSQRRFLSHTRKKAGLKTLLRKHSVQRIWPAARCAVKERSRL